MKIVCLSNSFKEGGKCIAGIELDANNNLIRANNGHPHWIRPVCKHTAHGEIPNELAQPFNLLDIIELNDTQHIPAGYQSENILFDVNSINKIGTFDKNKLIFFCNSTRYLFKTRYPSINEDVVQELDHSLLLIKPDKWKIVEKLYEDTGKTQIRMEFLYNMCTYDFPITDPAFLEQYKKEPASIRDTDKILLVLSVSVKFPTTNKYYKLIAGIINLEP